MADTTYNENIISFEYSEIMEKAYLDYAMSVIISRAIPDVRDGLKPVQRRTLYDMHELGIRHDKPFRKSARIVGDTMGKYHPHGDSSIYDALVVMSQDFKKAIPLVDGHGNFGSIEGDGAAAMRYTEARLAKVTSDCFLSDLDKDVVDFVPNFDENEKEPSVLPVKIPNLLINGAEGIAVGMTTSIPPHNLGEVVDGVIAYMKNPDINTLEMMEHIKGPDFPTGGIVTNSEDLHEIYSTGVGKIKVRGRIEIESLKGGRHAIVVTEIPYTMIGTGISKFLIDTAALVENKKTNDIVDISNQSSKEGIRIVIELKKGADIENVCNLLYQKTKLEDTFGVNMLSVADGRPEVLGIVPIIRHHVDFLYEINRRKYENMLEKERIKSEVQEGLIKATDVIDLIIEILRGSKDLKMAKGCLIEGNVEGIKFKSEQSKKDAAKLRFTERQAQAIVEMRLYRLIGLEVEALLRDHDKTLANIAEYEDILGKKSSMAKVIIKDLKEIRKNYDYARKTDIENIKPVAVVEQKIIVQDVYVLIDRFAYAKCIDVATYERNKESGFDEYKYVIKTSTDDKLGVFAEKGNMYLVKVADIPIKKWKDKGIPLDNISNFDISVDMPVFIESISHIASNNLIFTTKNANIKRVLGAEFDVSKKTTAATKLVDNDIVIAVSVIGDSDQFVMQSKSNYFLKIEAESIPFKKKTAVGVRGMKLGKNDELIYSTVLDPNETEIYAPGDKQVNLSRLHVASRDTKGVKR